MSDPSYDATARTAATPPARRPGPVPLLVAVTGHRDLREEDREALEAAVRGVLVDLRACHPHTPLALLSPLAEGADRLAARVALAEGARLVVPLPLPREIYERTFADDAARAEFGALIEQADEAFVLPTAPGVDAGALAEPGPQRDQQYDALAAWLGHQAHVLLALWDGAAGAQGGTGDAVRHRLAGPLPELLRGEGGVAELEPADIGPVHHILTPRAGTGQERGEMRRAPGTLRVLSPERGAPDVAATLAALERYNHDAVTHAAELAPAAARGRAYALGTTPESLPTLAEGMSGPARESLEHFGTADALALRFQRITDRARRRVFGLVFLAAAAFALFHVMPAHAPGAPGAPGDHGDDGHAATGAHAKDGEHVDEGDHAGGDEHATDDHASDDHAAEDHAASPFAWLLAAPWGLLLASLAFSGLASFAAMRLRRADAQNRYQDARALAEALRVELFWRLAGIEDDVADHYRGMQRGELAWIRRALRAVSLRPPGARALEAPAASTADVALESLDLVRDAWVRAQLAYFSHKAEAEHGAHERSERRVRALLTASIGLSLLLAAILVVPLLLPVPWMADLRHGVETPLWHGAFLFSIVTCAIAAGLVHTYDQHLARAEHVKRYARMGALFATAAERLDALDRTTEPGERAEGSRAILRRLGAEALAENGEWLVLHRERPLEKPHAG